MTLRASVFAADLELRDAVEAADRLHGRRRSLFVRLSADDGEGWAECATALDPGPDATIDEVTDALDRRVLDLAFDVMDRRAASSDAPTVVAALVSGRPADRMAAGVLDASLLDRHLRKEGRTLAASLGTTVVDLGFAGVLGLSDPVRSREWAAELVGLGATRLRVKVSPESGTEAIEAVLDAVHVPVVADANGAFRPGEIEPTLTSLLELPLAWIEQPFASSNLAAHAVLAEASSVPIGLDESVHSVRSVRDIARYGAGTILCCKPMRLGGIMRTRAVQVEATRLGLSTYVGGYFETGLGRSVLGALAAAGGDLDGDVIGAASYLVADPCGQGGPVEGRQPVYGGPGCGPVPSLDALTCLFERVF